MLKEEKSRRGEDERVVSTSYFTKEICITYDLPGPPFAKLGWRAMVIGVKDSHTPPVTVPRSVFILFMGGVPQSRLTIWILEPGMKVAWQKILQDFWETRNRHFKY
jgi:hypothetical protein